MLTVSRQFHSAVDGVVSVSHDVDSCIKMLGRCFPNVMLTVMSRRTVDMLHISDRLN